MYAEGRGVVQSYKQAFIWLSLAATGGNNNASIFRDQIALKLTPEAIADANLKIKVLMNQIEENKNK
jgi:TPR repeat protein